MNCKLDTEKRQRLHKPVTKAMDKYNYGRFSQLEALENELNESLHVKPGDQINLK